LLAYYKQWKQLDFGGEAAAYDVLGVPKARRVSGVADDDKTRKRRRRTYRNFGINDDDDDNNDDDDDDDAVDYAGGGDTDDDVDVTNLPITLSEVKRIRRKLSVKYHPDKIARNASEEEVTAAAESFCE
jgi:curved DNA-binding protein CbpA